MTKKSKFEIRKPPPGVSQAQESITFERLEEYPYKSVALASTRANLTGLWRYWRPYFETKRAPCDAHCPVGNRIVDYIQTLLDGEWREAATILRSENPLPAITGRLCHRPCEVNCNRRQYDERIAIHDVESVLAEAAYKLPVLAGVDEPRSVAVVGSGAAELSLAHFMALLHHRVTIFEPGDQLGGELRHGRGARQLPDGLLDAEIARIVEDRVAVEQRKVEMAELEKEVDVVFGSVGGPEHLVLRVSGHEAPARTWDSELEGWLADGGIMEGAVIETPSLVSEAIGYGKWIALILDAGWRGLDAVETLRQIAVGADERIVSLSKYAALLQGAEWNQSEEVVGYDKLNLDLLEPATEVTQDMVQRGLTSVTSRFAGEDDVAHVLSEAARCFSCGRCNDCGNCWIYCPDGVVLRVDGEYEIDYDYCKGCRVCAAVCPRGVISVIEEEEWNE